MAACRWRLGREAGVRRGVALVLLAANRRAAAQVLDQFLPAVSLGDAADTFDTVRSHSRVEFDNRNIQFPGLVIRPNIEESAGFDDNILVSRQQLSSAELRTQATVSAVIDLRRESLAATFITSDVHYLP